MMPSAPTRRARKGFSLAELLAVLAVLAILAGLAWPRLLGMLTRSELTEAGKRVRSALVQARLRAIESGQPWIFRFTPGTGRFEVLPARARFEEGRAGLGPDMAASSAGHFEAGTAAFRSADQPSNILLRPFGETLPGGVVFESHKASSLFESDLSAAIDGPAGQGPDDGQIDQRLLFQANGRAPDARIVLVGPDGRRLEVVFRGLIGTATVGSPLRKTTESLPEDDFGALPDSRAPGTRLSPEAAPSVPSADSTESEEAFWSEFLAEG